MDFGLRPSPGLNDENQYPAAKILRSLHRPTPRMYAKVVHDQDRWDIRSIANILRATNQEEGFD